VLYMNHPSLPAFTGLEMTVLPQVLTKSPTPHSSPPLGERERVRGIHPFSVVRNRTKRHTEGGGKTPKHKREKDMETKGKRKPYSKPQVHQVKLKIEEAVLQACKTTAYDTSGKANQYCGHSGCKKEFGS